MERKTRERILDVLKENENEELESLSISKRIGLSYDTTSKHLKRMVEEHVLTRKARQRPKSGIYFKDLRRPWEYYYKLNERYQK